MTKRQLLNGLDSYELTEWEAYFQLEAVIESMPEGSAKNLEEVKKQMRASRGIKR